jgi:hypothetical protein
MKSLEHFANERRRIARVDNLILREVDQSGAKGITAWEIEERLRPEVGACVHQSVTANLRHLVECGAVIALRLGRLVANRRRRVYLSNAHYSMVQHGAPLFDRRRERRPESEAERERCRRIVANSKPGSLHDRILELIRSHVEGLTCHEIEEHLACSHQTISARLAELRQAGVVKNSGRKRQRPGESRPLSVYEIAIEHTAQSVGLFG